MLIKESVTFPYAQGVDGACHSSVEVRDAHYQFAPWWPDHSPSSILRPSHEVKYFSYRIKLRLEVFCRAKKKEPLPSRGASSTASQGQNTRPGTRISESDVSSAFIIRGWN